MFGIVRGSGDRFYPDRNITRDEMAVMIVRAFRHIEPQGESLSFNDVPATHWAANEINKVSSAGIINGYGAQFKPKELATRAQAIVMLTRDMLVETAHAPTEYYITNVMTEFINQENVHYEQATYEELPALYDHYSRGYYRAMSLYWKNYWQALRDDGTNVVFETSDDFVITPYYISSHLAIVEVTGFNYSYTIDGQQTVTTNSDGDYYLIKELDGSWKIYNYYGYYE